jgi:hypothetical protein
LLRYSRQFFWKDRFSKKVKLGYNKQLGTGHFCSL